MKKAVQSLYKIRLLPLVIASVAVLFVLKASHLVIGQGYSAFGTDTVFAQDTKEAKEPEEPKIPEAGEKPQEGQASQEAVTPATPAEDKEKKEAENATKVTDDNAQKNEAVEKKATDAEKALIEGGPVPAAEQLSKSISERRRELDRFEEELSVRKNLLEASKLHINEQMQNLKDEEQRLGAIHDEKQKQREAEVNNLIVMYESMKAKDAARIFDLLDMKILVEVAKRINPRKLADIMGKMNPERAEALTVSLASTVGLMHNVVMQQPAEDTQTSNELPRIEGTINTLQPQ